MEQLHLLERIARGAAAVVGRGGGRVLRSRTLVRLPIGLYRKGLGFLFGSRLLMLEHVGRRSGVRRYAVLEVVCRPTSDTYVVASGFGAKAQWFCNVSVDPRVRVWSGRRGPTPATARVLAPAEADAALSSYAEHHRRAWSAFRPVLENTLGSPVTARGAKLPMVELRLDPLRERRASPGRGVGDTETRRP